MDASYEVAVVGVLSKSSATYKKKETFCVSKSAESAIFHFPSTTILKQTYDTATATATVSGLLSGQPIMNVNLNCPFRMYVRLAIFKFHMFSKHNPKIKITVTFL